MGMPTSVEEVNAVNPMINGVDSADLMSVDSTEPVEMVVEEEAELILPGEENASNKDKEESKESKKESGVEETEKKTEKRVVSKAGDKESELTDSKSVQKRIGKLTKKMRTAERERDFERERIAALEKQLEEAKIPANDKPDKTDFEDEDDFIEALTEWKVDEKLKTSQKKAPVKTKEEVEQQVMYEELADVTKNGEAKYDDFRELTTSRDLNISLPVVKLALDTDTPEDILYYLASNPEESDKISKLSQIKAAKEIGKLEVKLEVEEEEGKKLPKKKQSKAPAPIKPVTANGVTEKDPNKMSVAEYRAYREGQTK